MIITYQWEESDIQTGRYIIRQSSTPGHSNTGFACSVAYKIGWMTNPGTGTNYYCLIAITDGMILRYESKGELVRHLNEDTHGYRALNHDQVMKLIDHLSSQNAGCL